MAATIPVLWSDDISVDVLSPLAIMQTQVAPLSQRTRGILEAEIETISSGSGKVQHQFDLVAPVLSHLRRRILLATHQKDLVYPVVVEAECFISEDTTPVAQLLSRAASARDPNKLLEGQRQAATEQEFVKILEQILRSDQIRSLIQSLIARSNDLNGVSKIASVSEQDPE
jgi:hypothetical protein